MDDFAILARRICGEVGLGLLMPCSKWGVCGGDGRDCGGAGHAARRGSAPTRTPSPRECDLLAGITHIDLVRLQPPLAQKRHVDVVPNAVHKEGGKATHTLVAMRVDRSRL